MFKFKSFIMLLLLTIVPSFAMAEKGFVENPDYQSTYYDYDTESSFRCEIVVIVIDFSDNYRRRQFSIWGQGDSWGRSRQSAFSNYGTFIGSNHYSRNQFNHQFHFNNCFDRRGGGSGRGGDY